MMKTHAQKVHPSPLPVLTGSFEIFLHDAHFQKKEYSRQLTNLSCEKKVGSL